MAFRKGSCWCATSWEQALCHLETEPEKPQFLSISETSKHFPVYLGVVMLVFFVLGTCLHISKTYSGKEMMCLFCLFSILLHFGNSMRSIYWCRRTTVGSYSDILRAFFHSVQKELSLGKVYILDKYFRFSSELSKNISSWTKKNFHSSLVSAMLGSCYTVILGGAWSS